MNSICITVTEQGDDREIPDNQSHNSCWKHRKCVCPNYSTVAAPWIPQCPRNKHYSRSLSLVTATKEMSSVAYFVNKHSIVFQTMSIQKDSAAREDFLWDRFSKNADDDRTCHSVTRNSRTPKATAIGRKQICGTGTEHSVARSERVGFQGANYLASQCHCGLRKSCMSLKCTLRPHVPKWLRKPIFLAVEQMFSAAKYFCAWHRMYCHFSEFFYVLAWLSRFTLQGLLLRKITTIRIYGSQNSQVFC